jgi:hypothetical protein
MSYIYGSYRVENTAPNLYSSPGGRFRWDAGVLLKESLLSPLGLPLNLSTSPSLLDYAKCLLHVQIILLLIPFSAVIRDAVRRTDAKNT